MIYGVREAGAAVMLALAFTVTGISIDCSFKA
jgi:hypothetical protein